MCDLRRSDSLSLMAIQKDGSSGAVETLEGPFCLSLESAESAIGPSPPPRGEEKGDDDV